MPRSKPSDPVVTNIPAALRPNSSTPTSRRRRLALALAAVTVVSLAVAGPAFADFWTPESGGSPNADRIDTLYKLVLVVAAVVFIGVEGALLYSLFKFRARKGAVAAQIRGNTRLEIGWTVGAAVILVILAVATFIKLPGIRNPENSGPGGLQTADTGILTAQVDARKPPNGKSLDIDVNGQQYIWRYTYPDGDNNTLNNPFSYEEMVVPVETTVTLNIRAQDVAHSWWIPKLGGKFDAVPGYTNHTWFKIPAKFAGGTFAQGTLFRGQCAELCGRNHANMTAQVRAVTPAQFEQWIASRKAEVKQADDAAAAERKKLDAQLNGQ
ncbi:MAG: cytochrome c oxidase subunit [Solirubrobacteraceae bacterium]|nr:cytochrome c oxidase subunit [Solirubrobacteraceae bacterium]